MNAMFVSRGWLRILLIFLIVWLILAITTFPMLGNLMSLGETKASERLAKALADLDALRKQNIELQEIFKDISLDSLKNNERQAIENFQERLTKARQSSKHNNYNYVTPKEEPDSQYESLRRRIYSNTNEMWNYMKSSLLEVQSKVTAVSPEAGNLINDILNLGIEHKRSLLHDIARIADVDGYAMWREKESNELSNLVQGRFKYLQNPPDCKTAKKLVCNLNKGCGFGCQLHHVVYCFIVAYGTKRTLIMKSKGWRYHTGGWEDIFMPISDTCLEIGDHTVSWPGSPDDLAIMLPIIDSLSPKPPYLPLAIPEDLAPRLTRLHGDPIVWWVGQILKYLLRPQQKTSEKLQEAMISIGFKRPIVGVHVRRTDKVGTEASFHGLDEYMAAVDEYYNQLELTGPVETRRVYIATDEPKVIAEAKSNYPNYEILGDPNISITASVGTRYSGNSLFGIIFDIHMLSMSDFLVCTFSSQVCRVAYEIMQNFYPDASGKFRSLDDIYYYGGQNAHSVRAVLPHKSRKPGEISFSKGDLIGIAGNHWNGFSKGRNHQNVGVFPGFKTENKVETAQFPTYSEVNRKNSDGE